MSRKFSFVVYGDPVAQPRQRHSFRHGISRSYTPKSHPVTAYKASVREAAMKAMARESIECHSGPVVVTINLVTRRPKSMTERKFGKHRRFSTVKPDCDNAAKSVLDALNATAFVDDSMVCDLRVVKMRAAIDEEPHTHVTIELLRDLPIGEMG